MYSKIRYFITIPTSIMLLLILPLDSQAKQVEDPCLGNSALLSILDRPTTSDSVCVVPFKQAVVEMGYQYLDLTDNGRGQTYSESEVRVGLPFKNEIRALLPNYIKQTSPSQSGYSATALGFKHELSYNEHWIWTVDMLLTTPSGSATVGSYGYGYMLAGIVSYSLNDKVSIDAMLSASSLTQSSSAGGGRFFTVNPSLVTTYLLKDNLQFFAEIYGQSRTGPGENPGFNFDGGVQYLINHYVEVDTEVGQRIGGSLFGFNHYIGVGMGLLL